jgi:hypothetical protein
MKSYFDIYYLQAKLGYPDEQLCQPTFVECNEDEREDLINSRFSLSLELTNNKEGYCCNIPVATKMSLLREIADMGMFIGCEDDLTYTEISFYEMILLLKGKKLLKLLRTRGVGRLVFK